MKRLLQATLLAVFVIATNAFTCAQNGPTQPQVNLTWTQSTTPGITGNCVYRGSTAGVYTLPAIFCSTAAITTYTDNSVQASTTYHYAVTAQKGSTESQYSNDATAVVPALPNPPTLNNPTETGAAKKTTAGQQFRYGIYEKHDDPDGLIAVVGWNEQEKSK